MMQDPETGVVSAARISISKTFTLHMGHRLPNHQGKCKRLHGHSYRIDLMIGGEIGGADDINAPDRGMILDFDLVKAAWLEIDNDLDHHTLLWEHDEIVDELRAANGVIGANIESLGIVVVPEPPTAEYIAGQILHDLRPKFRELGAVLHAVRVWETETSWAIAEAGHEVQMRVLQLRVREEEAEQPAGRVN